jgi:hypothetical protein
MRQELLLLIVLLVIVACSYASPPPAVRVNVVQVFDADVTEAEVRSAGAEAEGYSKALDFRARFEPEPWFEESFYTPEDSLTSTTSGGRRGMTASRFGEEDGFCFKGQGGTSLCYESKRGRWLWWAEMYSHRMTMRDPSGKQLWRAKVPPLHVPVYPFVKDGWIVYIGFDRSEFCRGDDCLIIIDATTGKIATELDLSTLGIRGFSFMNPAPSFPVFRDGFIVLQSYEPRLPEGPRGKVENGFGRIAVLRIVNDE